METNLTIEQMFANTFRKHLKNEIQDITVAVTSSPLEHDEYCVLVGRIQSLKDTLVIFDGLMKDTFARNFNND
jgi:TATA-box binding protein (TBP) (component of TFIID and TFIIIB)